MSTRLNPDPDRFSGTVAPSPGPTASTATSGLRNLIIIGSLALIVALAALIYVSAGTFANISTLVLTAQDLFFPQANQPPASAASASPQKKVPLTGFAAKFQNHLITMEDGTAKPLDSATLSGVKYWAFYYSASWCPPCRAFTPDLVSFYRDFKSSHPDFELIFVNDDRSESDMLDYMKNDSMPWPAIQYADIDESDLEAKKYCGSGIPCLVLVDADGQVLSDTFQGGQYTDPHHVIDDIRSIVK